MIKQTLVASRSSLRGTSALPQWSAKLEQRERSPDSPSSLVVHQPATQKVVRNEGLEVDSGVHGIPPTLQLGGAGGEKCKLHFFIAQFSLKLVFFSIFLHLSFHVGWVQLPFGVNIFSFFRFRLVGSIVAKVSLSNHIPAH